MALKCRSCGGKRWLKAFVYIGGDKHAYPEVWCQDCFDEVFLDRTDVRIYGNVVEARPTPPAMLNEHGNIR